MQKVIVITGGSSGIGQSIANYYNNINYKTIILANNVETDLEKKQIYVDMSDYDSISAAFEKLSKITNKIDVLFNSAGYGLSGITELLNIVDIDKQFRVNVVGLMHFTNLCLSKMSSGSKIFNISSAMAYMPLPYRTMYAASKSAVSVYTQGLGMELKQLGITACEIAPGDVRTNFTANRVKNFDTVEKYGQNMQKITAKLDNRQNKRMPLEYVTNKIINIMNKRNIKPFYIVGKRYKMLYTLQKFLPRTWLLWYIEKNYSGRKIK